MTSSLEKPLYGVNLGGWLVLEKWMTPTLFDGYEAHDERAFMREEGASERLLHHRRTFITKEDMQWLATHGVTAVRVPVGYWLFGGEAPYESCEEQLDWLIDMAAAHDMQVIIDLHRAPGAPDGHDTGGEIAPFAWFSRPDLREKTLNVLERLAKRYGQREHVWGIEVLNEPRLTWKRVRALRDFYRQAYERMTPHMRSGMAIILSDGFRPLRMNGVVRARTRNPVVLDVHFYHFHVPFDGWRTLAGHLRKVRRRKWLLAWLTRQQPVLVGEWSGVISGQKMRRVPSHVQREFEEAYIAVQQKVHRYGAGQFYWNYKTEHPGIWNYRSLVASGRIDTPEV